MFSLKNLKNHDYIITIGIGLLTILSLLLIYSTTYNATSLETGIGTFQKQIIFFIIGSFIYFILSSISISWLKHFRFILLLYLSTIGLLLYLVFFGETIAGTNRWITLFGFNFQPAEYAKIVLVLITSYLFSNREEVIGDFVEWNKGIKLKGYQRIKHLITNFYNRFPDMGLFVYSAILTIPIITLVFLQPSFGNSIIITFIWLAVIFAATSYQSYVVGIALPILLFSLTQWGVINIDLGFDNTIPLTNLPIGSFTILLILTIGIIFLTKLKWYFIFIILILGMMAQPITMQLWESNVLSDYQKERVNTFFESPENDPLDAGYQVRQAKIAIGSGQLTGRGYLQGTQSSLQVLPYAHTDFIFAALGEQFGLFGAVILLTIYTTIIVRILFSVIQTSDEFSFLLGVGISVMLLLNIFINVGMNMGKLPVTGIPLPLMSYGGSAVLINMIGLGLIQSIRKDIKLRDISESFTPMNSPWR